MRRLLCVLDISTGLGAGAGATGRWRCHGPIQLLHKPSPRHRHSASVSWVWRGHLDPIHVRNVMGVQLPRSPVVLRTDRRLDSSGKPSRGRPIADRCVSPWLPLLCRGYTCCEETDAFLRDPGSKPFTSSRILLNRLPCKRLR